MILCAFCTYQYFHDHVAYLLIQYFNLTVQSSHIIPILSLCIVQTDHTISLDQGEYIYDLIAAHYGTNVDRIKTVTTPMHSDSAFERELLELMPLTDEELKEYSLKYKGIYCYHTGKLQYAVTYTRFDLGF